MDVSLDDYITKSNFKVKIGNPGFKGNNNPKVTTGGFQLGKKKFGGVPHQGIKVTDVSITVPAERKVGGNINKTNQIRDARDKLVAKNQVRDAREKLNKKAQSTDARQKLLTIRARKEPVDARAKIQAKKQQGAAGQGPGPAQTTSRGFTLTRTVANNHNNNIQLTPGAQGGIHITKILTKVMPPGYEGIVAPTQSPQTARQTKAPSGVKLRLGPPAGPNSSILNITRTVSTNQVQQHVTHTTPLYPPQQSPAFQPYPQHGGAAPLPYPVASHLPPQQQAPSVQQTPPPMHYTDAPPQPPYPTAPQPGQYIPPPYQAPSVLQGHLQAPPPQPHQAPPPNIGPPYPVEDSVTIRRTIGQEVSQHPQAPPPLPVIQVQNDQYRRPEQQYQHYSAQPSHPFPPQQPQYSYPTSQQLYPAPAEPVVHRTIPDMVPNENTFVKTIVNDSSRQPSPVILPLKRKSTSSPSTSGSSGPLRLSSTNTVPFIATQDGSRGPAGGARGSGTSNPYKYTRPAETVSSEPVVKKLREERLDDNDVISPLQGYKIVITNLHSSVSQDDVIELFGAIGAVKKVKLVKPGTAEVLYVKKDDAVGAAKTYHERELDGQPMVVKMVTPVSARVREPPEKLPPSVKPVAAAPLKLSKKPAGMGRASDKDGVAVDVLHKALFKSGTTGSLKPVTFTVKI